VGTDGSLRETHGVSLVKKQIDESICSWRPSWGYLPITDLLRRELQSIRNPPIIYLFAVVFLLLL